VGADFRYGMHRRLEATNRSRIAHRNLAFVVVAANGNGRCTDEESNDITREDYRTSKSGFSSLYMGEVAVSNGSLKLAHGWEI
jgi:hypothetical protein